MLRERIFTDYEDELMDDMNNIKIRNVLLPRLSSSQSETRLAVHLTLKISRTKLTPET
jgi:hypothetical protein